MTPGISSAGLPIHADLSPETYADTIAAALLARISQHVIPATFPPETGEWIRKTTQGRAMVWAFSMPLTAGQNISWHMTAMATGAISIEARDSWGTTFWRGVLAPADEAEVSKAAHDA